jgi:hypothetical protein
MSGVSKNWSISSFTRFFIVVPSMVLFECKKGYWMDCVYGSTSTFMVHRDGSAYHYGFALIPRPVERGDKRTSV